MAASDESKLSERITHEGANFFQIESEHLEERRAVDAAISALDALQPNNEP